MQAKILSRILRIDRDVKTNKSSSSSSSSPDIELISKLKKKIDIDNPIENLQLIDNLRDNSLFRLSIKDFENICKDKDTDAKELFNIMVKVLDTDKKKLTKICNNIDIFKEHINSSSESIKNKIKMQKMSILDLPDDMRKKIVTIWTKRYMLQDWIPQHYIIMECLSANYNAIDFLSVPENQKFINYPELSKNKNPEAINLIKKRLLEEKKLPYEKLKKEKNKIDWEELLGNSVAINGLEKEFEEYFYNRYYLEAEFDLLGILISNENSKAIQILNRLLNKGKFTINEDQIDMYWSGISSNPSPEAFALLEENPEKIYWDYLSGNTHPGAIKLLEEAAEEQMNWDMDEIDNYAELDNNEKIDWVILSANPKAIHIINKKWEIEKHLMKNDIEKYNKLKELDMIVSWNLLPSNRELKAIKLIEEKIKLEEDLLSKDEFNRLNDNEKINWNRLSFNPNAIKILKDELKRDVNSKRINWKNLSANPKAIELIKQKIEEEGLQSTNKLLLDKMNLSKNPSIFISK